MQSTFVTTWGGEHNNNVASPPSHYCGWTKIPVAVNWALLLAASHLLLALCAAVIKPKAGTDFCCQTNQSLIVNACYDDDSARVCELWWSHFSKHLKISAFVITELCMQCIFLVSETQSLLNSLHTHANCHCGHSHEHCLVGTAVPDQVKHDIC